MKRAVEFKKHKINFFLWFVMLFLSYIFYKIQPKVKYSDALEKLPKNKILENSEIPIMKGAVVITVNLQVL